MIKPPLEKNSNQYKYMTKIRPKTTRTSKDEERDSINKTSVNNTVLTPYEKKKNSAQKNKGSPNNKPNV